MLFSIGAVNWVINQAKSTGRPSVINISVKFPPNDLLDAVVTDAVNAGVHVVVSAGNAASDASTQVRGVCHIRLKYLTTNSHPRVLPPPRQLVPQTL